MKKTISITIGNTPFHLEEDAYAALDRYLDSVRAYFTTDSDDQEILKDIESRIAERFIESGSKTITLSQVEEIIKDMGTVEQLAEANDEPAEMDQKKRKTVRTLFRDPDNAIVAGISSGLGHYFNIDPILFRVLFIALTLTSGIGIILYIILWIVVPEAQTASQKLSMRGNPINLNSMRNMASDAIRDGVSKARNPIRRSVKFIERNFLGFIRICVGITLGIISFGGILAATVAAGMALSGYPVILFDPTVAAVLSGPLFFAAAITLYAAIVAPLAFAGLCASDLLFKTSKVTKANSLLLLSVWFVSLVAAGVLVTSTVFRSIEAVSNDPRSIRETRALEVSEAFTKIKAKDVHVKLVRGDQVRIEAEGQKRSIENLNVKIVEGSLVLENKETEQECLFCYTPSPQVIITVPTVSEVTLENSSRLSGEVSGQSLSLALLNSSTADLNLTVQGLDARLENASRASLSGTATFSTSTLRNGSRIEAQMLKTENAVVNATNGSRAEIHATKSLSVAASNASRVEYAGGAVAEKELSSGSRIVDLDEERRKEEQGPDIAPDASDSPAN
ncbi:MAG TPA: DUF2807 domain-containing protein [Candidatus Paceibacterota bacterium]